MKELIICNSNDKRNIYLVEDEELVEKYQEDENKKSIQGNIYVGKVQNVLNGLQAAFINIGENKNAFIHVKDILPKIDITKETREEIPPISKLIKSGDSILVEVKKEAIDKKGPRLSTHINFSSRFIVFLPNATFITVSSKIENEGERNRLKEIAKKYLPEGTGAIIRTVAEGKDEAIIANDIEKTVEKWEKLKQVSIDEVPKKIFDKGGVLRKTILDLVDNNLDKIVVDTKKDIEVITQIVDELESDIKVEYDPDILEKYNLKKQIEALNNNKIWLKSGAFINIDKTEALFAIDVNSGKFVGDNDSEETITKVNLEAAKEIAKQIRLRDISGIIIIDFIDMHEDKNKQAVIDEIKRCSKKDRSKIQVEEFTKLNLMEITRKNINSSKKGEIKNGN